MNTDKQIKLAIIDDHNLFRKGLIKLINLGDVNNKYTLLFEAENGYELKDKIDKKNLPDIIIMDIDMPDMDGYEAVSWLTKFYPDISILVVSMLETEESVIRMIKLGVKGYLSKDIEVEDMHNALTAIAGKSFYYSDNVMGVISQSMQNNDENGDPKTTATNLWNSMSENEKEFLKLSCTELTYIQIAAKMNLSPKTIDGYREALFIRFKVRSRVMLALFAYRNGFVH
ncbi:MAG: response regulator transcription factor [Ferruginibacter sp.]